MMDLAESKREDQCPGSGSESIGVPDPLTMYEIYQLGKKSVLSRTHTHADDTSSAQPGGKALCVLPTSIPTITTGSGIYFEDHEVPLPLNYTRKRRLETPKLVDGKAMMPPPALYHDFRLLKKRCTQPVPLTTTGIPLSVTCQSVNHRASSTSADLECIVHEEAGFREAALALTSLCGVPKKKKKPFDKPPPPLLQPPPRLASKLSLD